MATRARLEPIQRAEAAPPRTPMSEEELEAFYRQVFLPLVRRATWRHGLSREDARDIVQDAFLVAIAKIDSAGNPKAWLLQVVDHLSLNHQRKTLRRAELAARWSLGESSERRFRDPRESSEW